MFSRFFIDRPIFAAVLSIFIVLAGLAAMRNLPIAQYPEIAPPVVTVQAGDRVITEGLMRLGPGAPVRIAEAGANAPAQPTGKPAAKAPGKK